MRTLLQVLLSVTPSPVAKLLRMESRSKKPTSPEVQGESTAPTKSKSKLGAFRSSLQRVGNKSKSSDGEGGSAEADKKKLKKVKEKKVKDKDKEKDKAKSEASTEEGSGSDVSPVKAQRSKASNLARKLSIGKYKAAKQGSKTPTTEGSTPDTQSDAGGPPTPPVKESGVDSGKFLSSERTTPSTQSDAGGPATPPVKESGVNSGKFLTSEKITPSTQSDAGGPPTPPVKESGVDSVKFLTSEKTTPSTQPDAGGPHMPAVKEGSSGNSKFLTAQRSTYDKQSNAGGVPSPPAVTTQIRAPVWSYPQKQTKPSVLPVTKATDTKILKPEGSVPRTQSNVGALPTLPTFSTKIPAPEVTTPDTQSNAGAQPTPPATATALDQPESLPPAAGGQSEEAAVRSDEPPARSPIELIQETRLLEARYLPAPTTLKATELRSPELVSRLQQSVSAERAPQTERKVPPLAEPEDEGEERVPSEPEPPAEEATVSASEDPDSISEESQPDTVPSAQIQHESEGSEVTVPAVQIQHESKSEKSAEVTVLPESDAVPSVKVELESKSEESEITPQSEPDAVPSVQTEPQIAIEETKAIAAQSEHDAVTSVQIDETSRPESIAAEPQSKTAEETLEKSSEGESVEGEDMPKRDKKRGHSQQAAATAGEEAAADVFFDASLPSLKSELATADRLQRETEDLLGAEKGAALANGTEQPEGSHPLDPDSMPASAAAIGEAIAEARSKLTENLGTAAAANTASDAAKPAPAQQLPEKREHLYKILVIGELGTGKTSIIKRYVHQFFSQHYRATIGVDFALKVLNWDANTIIRLQLWDIAGQERFGNMTRVYYKEAVGAFVVFDVTRVATFDAVLKWKQDLDSKVTLPDGSPIPCVLLANKCDQQKEGIVNNPAKMDEYCKDKGFSAWFETSAKENINIEEAARTLVKKILLNDKLLYQNDAAKDPEKINLDSNAEAKSGRSCAC